MDPNSVNPKPAEHIIQFFAYEHLPAHLAAVSKPFCDLALAIVGENPGPGDPDQNGLCHGTEFGVARGLPRNPERTVALRKLLESKDAAVRALLAKDVQP